MELKRLTNLWRQPVLTMRITPKGHLLQPQLPTAHVLTASTVSADETETGGLRSNYTSTAKKLKTVPIGEAFTHQASFELGGDKNSAITEALIFMIVKDGLPFLTPEKEGFRHFLKVCAPLYKPIGILTAAKLIDSKYELIATKVKETLTNVHNLSLTFDIWTDMHRSLSYLGITVHYLETETMEMKSIMLEVIPLEDRHTAVNIAHELKAVLQDWNIEVIKVTAGVTDNGANVKAAVDILLGTGKHVACVAHSLNLVPIESMKHIPDLEIIKEKVKLIVTYFKRSIVAADALRASQERAGCQTLLKLKQDVPTRFYSTYIMLERFVCLKDHIASVLMALGGPDMLTRNELNILDEVLTFLKPFQLAITELSAENCVTLSKVISLVNCITTTIQNCEATSNIVQQLKANFLNSFSKRFSGVEKQELLAIATLVDPRFKRIHFTNIDAHASVITKVATLVKSNQEMLRSSPSPNAEERNFSDQSAGRGLWAHHNRLLATVSAQGPDALDDIPVELQQFLSQLPSSLFDDPFKVWGNLKGVYPSVFPIAVKYLSVPASSIPCERLFSKAGRLVRDDRNRLDPKKIGKLCFLSSLDKSYWSL